VRRLPTLATQLALDYGRGFGEKNLRRMVKFAAMFPDEPIVATVSRQLSWSHLVLLLALKDPLQRDYYVQMASAERWSVRTLRERIDSMLYERTALSKKPCETIAQELATMRDAQRMSPALVMRDPYILGGVRAMSFDVTLLPCSDPDHAVRDRHSKRHRREPHIGHCLFLLQRRPVSRATFDQHPSGDRSGDRTRHWAP
jgi:DUF1016 N-terminal domain